MDRLYQDLRFSLRLLRKDLAFAVTAILTLSLCVGANAAIFAVVNSVLLKPLPVPEPDRLVLMHNSYPRAGVVRASNGVPDYYDRLARNRRLRRAGAVQHSRRHHRHRRRSAAGHGHDRPSLSAANAARDGESRAAVPGRRRGTGQRPQGGPDPRALAAAVRWGRLSARTRAAHQRPASRDHRHPPRRLPLCVGGYQTLDAVVLQPGRKVRRFAAQQQLVDDRAAQAWRHRHAGPAADRRAERAESRALPLSARGAHQRRIPTRSSSRISRTSSRASAKRSFSCGAAFSSCCSLAPSTSPIWPWCGRARASRSWRPDRRSAPVSGG